MSTPTASSATAAATSPLPRFATTPEREWRRQKKVSVATPAGSQLQSITEHIHESAASLGAEGLRCVVSCRIWR